MTKPITCVAVLMLYEEGRFHLDDPVSRFLPEFANERVFTGVDAQGALVTEAAKEPVTIRHLLTHTSGLGYVFDPSTPLGKAYNALPITAHSTLADVIRAIAGAPLYFEPGAGWRYSYADDVLGRLVEAVSGMSFERFLKTRLFEPLGMTHTGFYIAESDLPLLATLYKHGSMGELEPSDASMPGSPADPNRWPSGGGGLISTAGDYLRFAQMLENGGALNGKRILSPVTVALMSSNQVPEDAMLKFWGADSRGLGYGLGVGILIDAVSSPQAGFTGDYSWGGLWDTHWVASPRSGIVAVLLTQVDPRGNQSPQRTDPDFRNLLFASVERIDPPPRGRLRRLTMPPLGPCAADAGRARIPAMGCIAPRGSDKVPAMSPLALAQRRSAHFDGGVARAGRERRDDQEHRAQLLLSRQLLWR